MKLKIYDGKWIKHGDHPITNDIGEKLEEKTFKKYTDIADYLDTLKYDNNVMMLFIGKGLPVSVVYRNGTTWIESRGCV